MSSVKSMLTLHWLVSNHVGGKVSSDGLPCIKQPFLEVQMRCAFCSITVHQLMQKAAMVRLHWMLQRRTARDPCWPSLWLGAQQKCPRHFGRGLVQKVQKP